MTKPIGTIAQETPILPEVIAASVIGEVDRWAGPTTFEKRAIYASALVERAEALFQASTSFRKKIRSQGNGGRDYLYTFMRHWHAAQLLEHNDPAVRLLQHHGLWDRFCNGEQLPALPTEVSDARD